MTGQQKINSRGQKNEHFTSTVTNWVEANGLNASSLAEMLGVSKQTGYNCLNGRVPEWWVLVRLAGLMSTSVDWLLTGQSASSVTLPEIRRASRPMDLTPPSHDVMEILGKAWDVLEQDKAAAATITGVVDLAFNQLAAKPHGRTGPAAPEGQTRGDTRSALKTG